MPCLKQPNGPNLREAEETLNLCSIEAVWPGAPKKAGVVIASPSVVGRLYLVLRARMMPLLVVCMSHCYV